jgi:hypothetical protein
VAGLAVVAVVATDGDGDDDDDDEGGVINWPPTNIGDGVGIGNEPACGSGSSVSSSLDSATLANSRYHIIILSNMHINHKVWKH